MPSIANVLLFILVGRSRVPHTLHTHTHMHMHTHVRAHPLTCTHARAHAHPPIHILIRTHAHANTRYGGIANEYVRDGSGMIIGMLELGPDRWDVARKAMRYMLQQLQVRFGRGLSHSTLDVVHTHTHTNTREKNEKILVVLTNAVPTILLFLQCTQDATLQPGCGVALNLTRPPEVMHGDCPEASRKAGSCAYNKQIVAVDMNEETDGAFYVMVAWGRVVAVTGWVGLCFTSWSRGAEWSQ